MFTFKKAMNSFLAVGITAGSLMTQNCVKADYEIKTWEALSKNLDFERKEDIFYSDVLLKFKPYIDCTEQKVNPRWVLIYESENYRAYAMLYENKCYFRRSSKNKKGTWKVFLRKNDNKAFISPATYTRTDACNGSLALCLLRANKKLLEYPLCTCPIMLKSEKMSKTKVDQMDEQINIIEDEDAFHKEIDDLLFFNFLITEKIDSNDKKSKEKIIRWPCWIEDLINTQDPSELTIRQKSKEQKKETKSKESNLNHFPLNYMLDNESLMWFS